MALLQESNGCISCDAESINYVCVYLIDSIMFVQGGLQLVTQCHTHHPPNVKTKSLDYTQGV